MEMTTPLLSLFSSMPAHTPPLLFSHPSLPPRQRRQGQAWRQDGGNARGDALECVKR
jgi:hypothetical protein